MSAHSSGNLFAYGLFGLPLAMVALPVYVHAPQFYVERFGLPLSAIGFTLLVARSLDAFIDPMLGAWIDRRRMTHAGSGFFPFILLAAPFLAAGFIGLFQPPALAAGQPLLWLMLTLLLVYGGFSLASIAHQGWGAALTQSRSERARLTGIREACGLIGVVLAAALPGVLGFGGLLWVFVVTLLIGTLVLYWRAPIAIAPNSEAQLSWTAPLRDPRFRWLLAAFGLNGIAAAIPATLFLFFAKDRLQLEALSGLFLIIYFIAAAASMPLWVALARRHGEARAWLIGMLLAIAAFIWSYKLGAGDVIAFGVICALSGCALGADLALPPALLAGVIGKAGHSGKLEGAYFGIWNWMTKINLALAAGLALPLLERLGYAPGSTSGAEGLQALSIAYALLPCGLKLAAALVLWRAPLRNL